MNLVQVSHTNGPPPPATAVPLRPYQQDAIHAIDRAIARGVRRMAVELPTGAGKTVIFASWLATRPGRALVLAHRDELIQQAADKMRMVWPGAGVGIVKAAADDVAADVVVASVQTLAQPRRLERLANAGPFGTVVTDECHHAAAVTYRAIYDAIGAGRPDGPVSLGVSATLDRADGIGLDGAYDEIVYRVGIVDLIEAGYLADIRAARVRFNADAGQLRKQAGDISDSSAAAWFRSGGGPAAVAAAIVAHAPERRVLVFTPDVRTAHDTAATIAARGIAAAAVDGTTPTDQRRDTLARFRAGDVQALVNCALLTEGFDLPEIDCVIIGRPTLSRSLYCQMVGRGLRRHPGKDDLLLLDLVGATGRHDLESAASLFGLDPSDLDDDDTIAGAVARRRQREAIAAAEAQMVAVELMTRAAAVFRSRPARWLDTGDGRFVLPAGGARRILLAPDTGDRWSATITGGGRDERLIGGVSLELATGISEDHARRNGAGTLIDPRAAWRSEPATDKQLARLRFMGLAPHPAITKGEASDLITRQGVA